MSGRITIIAEHPEGNVQVSVPVKQEQTVEQVLGVAVGMVAASYRTYVDQPSADGGKQ